MNKFIIFSLIFVLYGCTTEAIEEKLLRIVKLGLEDQYHNCQFGVFREELFFFQSSDSTIILFKDDIIENIKIVSINSTFDFSPKTYDSLNLIYGENLILLSKYFNNYHVKQIESSSTYFLIKTDLMDSNGNDIHFNLITGDINKDQFKFDLTPLMGTNYYYFKSED